MLQKFRLAQLAEHPVVQADDGTAQDEAENQTRHEDGREQAHLHEVLVVVDAGQGSHG